VIRISVLAGVMAVLACAVSESAAATLQAPMLTSPAFASPVTIHWTPMQTDAAPEDGGGGKAHGHEKAKEEDKGQKHGDKADRAEQDQDARALPFQLVIRAAGACGALTASPRVIARFADMTTGDLSDPVADGTYCYWIEVTLGSKFAASDGLTVLVSGTGTPSGEVPADKVPPPCPGKLSFRFPRGAATRVPVRVHWRNPAAADLDGVELLINPQHAPRGPLDGRVAYRGLGHSFELRMRAGQTFHLALYAIDHSGNVSAPSRTLISLAGLVPMRPISGSAIHAAPLLTWAAKKGATYYNLQVFKRGRRVLTAWPRHPSYHVPAGKLEPGTYVWFVWPAMGTTVAAPRFSQLIGRATFVYSP
jgi:hypothetical protein